MRRTRSNKYRYSGHYLIFRGIVDGHGSAGTHWMSPIIVGQDALEIMLRSAFGGL